MTKEEIFSRELNAIKETIEAIGSEEVIELFYSLEKLYEGKCIDLEQRSYNDDYRAIKEGEIS